MAVRGPSAYTLFSQQFKRDSSKEDHFKEIAKKWAELPDDQKNQFRKDAKGIRSSELKGMSSDDATAHHFKQIQNSIHVLGSLGFEVMMVACKDNENPHLLGTKKGLECIGHQHQILEAFKKSVFGNTVFVKEPSKKGKDDLRQDVRQILNSCWEKATGEGKTMPYSALMDKKKPWKVVGLPVAFKDVSNYGISDLKKIIERKEEIQVVKLQPNEPTEVKEPGHEVIDSIISNELELETVHDLCTDSDAEETPVSNGKKKTEKKEKGAKKQKREQITSESLPVVSSSPDEAPEIPMGGMEHADVEGPVIPTELVDHMNDLLELNEKEAPVISLNGDLQGEEKLVKFSEMKARSSKWTYMEVDDLTAPKAFQPAATNTRKRKQKIHIDM